MFMRFELNMYSGGCGKCYGIQSPKSGIFIVDWVQDFVECWQMVMSCFSVMDAMALEGGREEEGERETDRQGEREGGRERERENLNQ